MAVLSTPHMKYTQGQKVAQDKGKLKLLKGSKKKKSLHQNSALARTCFFAYDKNIVRQAR